MAGDSRGVIFAALAGNSAIAVTKFGAAVYTGSSAMMAEGIHSLVDTGNQVLLLFGLGRSKRPANARFPFGHGKEVYFWSFVVAIMIFAVGAGISVYEGVHALLDPHPLHNPAVNYVVLVLAIAFESAAWWWAFRGFDRARGDQGWFEAVRRGKDPTLFVVLFEDSAALLGLLVALVAIAVAQATGAWWLDGVASIVIGLILGATAAWLAVETKGLLIGESARREVVEGMRRMIGDHDAIERVKEVLTMHVGPEYVLANVSVQVRGDRSAEEVSAAIESLDRAIRDAWPEVKRVFIEIERGPGG